MRKRVTKTIELAFFSGAVLFSVTRKVGQHAASIGLKAFGSSPLACRHAKKIGIL